MKNFLLALSIDCPATPIVNFKTETGFDKDGKRLSGCGFAWYPEDKNACVLLKDAGSFAETGRPKVIDEWRRFRSSTFLFNFYGASYDATLQNTQPYVNKLGGKEICWLHQGTLDIYALREIYNKNKKNIFQPLGTTDSELVFDIILNKCYKKNIDSIKDIGWENLYKWLKDFNEFGSANIIFSDGQYMVAFHGKNTPEKLYWKRRIPHNATHGLASSDNDIDFDFTNGIDRIRTHIIIASEKMSDNPNWKELEESQMIVCSHGSVIWNSNEISMKNKNNQNQKQVYLPQQELQLSANTNSPPNSLFESNGQFKNFVENNCVPTSREFDYYISNNLLHHNARMMQVTHETTYTYDSPIERSEHVFRLIPMYNRFQQVLEYSLDVDVPAERMIYRDVFNNDIVHMTIEKPYSEIKIVSKSKVLISRIDPDDFSHPLRKVSIPYAWMPGQRQMMQAYLMPQELPETQLRELTDFAMSFVRRNDYNLYETLKDINRTIYKDFKYQVGATELNTNAFEVYVLRKGVCQDFANLLICLARLLSIPARYRMGYIYTGADYANKIQSEATHAWAELYIPYVGWRGFDPTNGKQVDQDYIRVACGRNYLDATPTTGTIYKGGGKETLKVNVKTEIVSE
ncbi:MAG: class II glutamine amidotransferase [Rickettsiales bacterium]|nr:class II glutamine amidotransferase [Rickettsiales bacterium]